MFDWLFIAGEAATEEVSNNANLIIAAVSAAVAGLGVKLIDVILNRGEIKVDEATQLRAELRDESRKRAEELISLREELDSWKERYYELLHQYEEVRLEMETLKVIVARYENDNK